MLRRVWPIASVFGIYCFWGILLIAQKPGLQYDEAMLIAGAVHMEHSAGIFDLNRTPDAWTCPFGHCIPLMTAYYVGSLKEYAALPVFALFGPRAPFVRLVSLLLAAIGIWGIYILVAEWFGRWTATIATFLVAINPAFVSLTVFDNGALSAMIAALGVTCACLAIYGRRKTFWRAFALGAAMGLGLWARANFAWILIAGGVAALIVFRRRMLISAAHWIAILVGGLIGGSPFLAFQVLSGGATWKVQEAFAVSDSMANILRQRAFLFADTLLSDGEHRVMWAGPSLPSWQLWLFPGIVIAAWLVCLFGNYGGRKRGLPQALAITSLFTTAVLFLSRLPVAEHHLVVLVPFAAVMVSVACALLQARHAWALAVSASLFVIYTASAVYWQVAAVRGLRNSGGVGVWSDAGLQLARYLDLHFQGRDVKLIDWGLEYNMYVLTDGRLNLREIYAPASEDVSFQGKPWTDEIREGGVFVLNGPENRGFPKPSAGFLRALSMTRPAMRTYNVAQRNGRTYAEVFEIQQNSVRGPAPAGEEQDSRIAMDNVRLDSQLTGFYPPENGGFRWTKREFSARLGFPLRDPNGARLVVRLYVPDNIIQKLGPVTLRARVNGRALSPETWSQSGHYVYLRDLAADLIESGQIQADFVLDKSLPPNGSDQRELGIIVAEISVEPR
jgi:4-amino-4-deoxy-L-arabinose transferase-like glycosyltransferase